jgi:hypothetical protein
MSSVEDRSKAILAEGLKESGLSPAELRSMTPEELRDRVADFEIGGARLRDVLQEVE